jgi:hypothetical protein
VNLAAYQTELRNHDWHYSFSDDHEVWKRGSNERARLFSIATDGDDNHKRAYNEAYMSVYDNDTFGPNVQAPFTLG